MEHDTIDAIAGALTAQRFILENIYALILSNSPNPVQACQETAKELLRQFEDLPPTNVGEVDGDDGYRIIQHGVHHLERFWVGVEKRLQAATAKS